MSFSVPHFSDESVATIRDLALDKFFDLTLGNSLGFIGSTLANFTTTKIFEFFEEDRKKPSDSFLKTQGLDLLKCTGQNLYFTSGSVIAFQALRRLSPLVQKAGMMSLPTLLQMGWRVLNGDPVTSPSLKDLALSTISGLGNLRMGITDEATKQTRTKTASEHLLDHRLVYENLQGHKTTKTLSDFIKILNRENLERIKKLKTLNEKINLRICSKGYAKGEYVSITPDPTDIKHLVEYAHITVDLDDTTFGISNIQARSAVVRDRIVGKAYLNPDIPISQAYISTAFAGFGNDYLGSSKSSVPPSDLSDHIKSKKFIKKLEEAASIRPLNHQNNSPPQQFVLRVTTTQKTVGGMKVTASFEVYDPQAFQLGKDRNMGIIVEISPEGRVVVTEIKRAHLLSDHGLILDALSISKEDQLRLTTRLIRKERAPLPPTTPQKPGPKPKTKPEPEEILDPSPSPPLTHQPSVQFRELHTQWVESSPQINSTERSAIERELEAVECLLARLESRYPTFYKTYLASIQRWYQIHSSGRTNAQQMLNTIQQRKMEITTLGKSTDTHRMAS